MTTVEDLKKALDDWWNDYNHLLGDASGDSECRQKLRQIIKRFSVFQKDHEEENAVRIEQIKDEKNTKIDALQLAILTIYKPEIEKLKRKLDEVHKVVKDNVLVPRKQLFGKCAYVDFEGKPAIVCNLCRFYHGLQKGCSWEEERKSCLRRHRNELSLLWKRQRKHV